MKKLAKRIVSYLVLGLCLLLVSLYAYDSSVLYSNYQDHMKRHHEVVNGHKVRRVYLPERCETEKWKSVQVSHTGILKFPVTGELKKSWSEENYSFLIYDTKSKFRVLSYGNITREDLDKYFPENSLGFNYEEIMSGVFSASYEPYSLGDFVLSSEEIKRKMALIHLKLHDVLDIEDIGKKIYSKEDKDKKLLVFETKVKKYFIVEFSKNGTSDAYQVYFSSYPGVGIRILVTGIAKSDILCSLNEIKL